MNTKPEQLNEKIALWLGWKYLASGWNRPQESAYVTDIIPNFTASQDTHGPIIEKLRKKYLDLEITYNWNRSSLPGPHEVYCYIQWETGQEITGEHGTVQITGNIIKDQALAFCLAVEKIIDGE